MGRTSEFCFPTPGRLPEGPSGSIVPEISPRNLGDRARAEYFLGLGHPPIENTYDIKINSKSIAVPHTSYYGRSETNEPLGETPLWPKSGRALQSQPSPKVPGGRHSDTAEVPPKGGIAQTAGHQLSPPTLQSRYNIQPFPVFVPQQLSASSSQDEPFRKGVSTSGMAPSIPIPHSQSQPRVEVVEKTQTQPQDKYKRPSRLDMSRLLPRMKTSGESPLSSLFGHSPSSVSGKSGSISSPTSSTGKGRRWGLKSKKSKESLRTMASQSTISRSAGPDKYDSPKCNVKRPPRGIQHWFEALDVDDDEEEDDEKPDIDHSQSSDPSKKMANKASNTGQVPNGGPHQPAAKRKSSLGRDRFGVRDTAYQPPVSPIVGREAANVHTMSHNNLQNQSVLSLSSDEDETDAHPPRPRPSYDSYGDEADVTICKLPSLKNSVRRDLSQRKETETLRHSGLTSGSILIAPPTNHSVCHLTVPEQTRSPKNVHQKNQSQSSSVLNEEDPTAVSSNSSDPFDSRSSTPTQPTSPTTTITTVSTEPRRHRESQRAMMVTKEEEELLAMMRRKRAAMAKSSFSEGYRQALVEEQALLEEEVAERKRQTLLAMQARHREREAAPKTKAYSRVSHASATPAESPVDAKFPNMAELMDTSLPHREDPNRSKDYSIPRSSTQLTSTPTVPLRSFTSNISSAISSYSDSSHPPSISDFPSPNTAPLASIPVASPNPHHLPSPDTNPLDQNLLDSIMERSYSDTSTASATYSHASTATPDSPITPDQTESLPLAHRGSTPDCTDSSTIRSRALSSRNSSRSTILPIFPQSPPSKQRSPPPSQTQTPTQMPTSQGKSRGDVVSAQSFGSVKSLQSLNSVQSYNSVGADVLAAWGALGGWSQDERVRLGQF